MRQLGSSKKDVDQVKDGEDVPKFESVELLLVHCDLFSNNYQQVSQALFTFEPNKNFGQINTTAPHSLKMSNTTNTEFSLIEVWFANQNSKQLETKENDANNWVGILEMRYTLDPEYRKYVKGYEFLLFARKCGDE